jgi:pre-mRNA branch site protein p14
MSPIHTHELFVDASAAKAELARREEELAQLKKKHDIGDD